LSYLAYALASLVIISTAVGLAMYRPWIRPRQLIRVGVLKITPSLRYWIAEQKGIFEKHGLNVEIKDDYFSTNDIANDVAAGRIDVGHFATSTVFQAWSLSPEKMYIFTLDLNTPEDHIDALFVPSDSTVVRAEELRGKPIGKFPGEQSAIVLTSYLETQGLRPDEIVLFDVAPQNQIPTVMSGQVAALYAYEPVGTLLVQDYQARRLVDGVTVQILNPFPGGAGLFSSKFLSARAQDAPRFVEAMREVTELAGDPANNLEIRKILSERLSIRFDVAARTQWLVWRNAEEIDLANLQDYADFQLSHGQLSVPIDVRELMYRE